ncbi:hypothetical protein BZB76_5615 [Actinomadura pelletieri DSM 43383]|uniref:Uncharacterized protein n=1 Tax=Actinomadura pelletieri DSM 43383 TaxID=1120940 RepID=A0A495QGY9_9ACTN|nr:hypothetical protein [Actinomadura pelletieri]RKS71129.1 hypothetical protein BZB76_5615 [Actinomadura pelletieri DSM 43383]
MSSDLVALVRRRPDVHAVADGMIAMGEALELRGGESGPILVYDTEGRLLVSIEEAVPVPAQSEIRRLLGDDFAGRVTAPVWWVDVRAVADLPDAIRVARRFTEFLVHWAGGAVYPDGVGEAPARSWKAAGVDGQDGVAYHGGVIGG